MVPYLSGLSSCLPFSALLVFCEIKSPLSKVNSGSMTGSFRGNGDSCANLHVSKYVRRPKSPNPRSNKQCKRNLWWSLTWVVFPPVSPSPPSSFVISFIVVLVVVAAIIIITVGVAPAWVLSVLVPLLGHELDGGRKAVVVDGRSDEAGSKEWSPN